MLSIIYIYIYIYIYLYRLYRLSFHMYFALLNQAFRDNGQITFEISRLAFEASVGPIFGSIVYIVALICSIFDCERHCCGYVYYRLSDMLVRCLRQTVQPYWD